MRSIIQKLTLAFLLVGLTGSALVALNIRQRTQQAFDQFVFKREQITLVNNLLLFYRRNGSWEGVGGYFVPNSNENGELMTFALVGKDHKIVFSNQPGRVGDSITKRELDQAVELSQNSQVIGWLVLPQGERVRVPNSPEDLFLKISTGLHSSAP